MQKCVTVCRGERCFLWERGASDRAKDLLPLQESIKHTGGKRSKEKTQSVSFQIEIRAFASFYTERTHLWIRGVNVPIM